MPNQTADLLKHRLSLREPLQEALDIVAALTDGPLTLQKDGDAAAQLAAVKAIHGTCTDFERAFPSIAFSIATGVGKTRLMGACMAYLFLEKGIRNFFVLAPNLTIYDKLIEDFGNPAHPKYVFHGITEFVHNRPVIITGDNYAQQGGLFGEEEVRINIFNVAKFSRDAASPTRGKEQGTAPRIKRLSEYLGQSYWDYLSSLDDLVILMDEAHRYHADASKAAINELKPVLGLELTATPMDEKGRMFKNVVYEYSLAQALTDGKYVKNPAIAKRKDFVRGNLDDRQLEIIKLEDAISIHKDTREALEIYARNEDAKLVKPFILVVCKDTTHAREIFDLINSDDFYEGEYKGKALQIDSTTRQDDAVEKQFLALESPDSDVEIVIHVNMLKEGWDVTNLYTIVPLRAANAAVLVEQTIGRGLRLPYDGKRTGVDKIDKLTIVAHENFDAVVEAAKDPNSILNKVAFVEVSVEQLSAKTTVVTSKPVVQAKLEEEQQAIDKIEKPEAKQAAQNNLDARKAIVAVLPDFNSLPGVRKVEDLQKPEVKARVLEKIEENLNKGQGNIFADQIVEEASVEYEALVTQYAANIIEIPRMALVQDEVEASFDDFDLDTAALTYQALNQEIIRMGLRDNQVDTVEAKSSGYYGDPINLIIAEVINFPEVDYDDNADLLYKLARQAYDAIRANLPDPDEAGQVVFQFKAAIAEKIHSQMKAHFSITEPDYAAPQVLPFVRIEPWNFSALTDAGYADFRDTIQPTSLIPKLVFRGFRKACHFEYKFDSKTEQDLAFVLEHDKDVLKWMRPAPNQFRIYWDNNARRYEPDFVVETTDAIYILETKMSTQIDAADVQAKARAAEKYCGYARDFTMANGGKPWRYAVIPHNAVTRTSSMAFLLTQFAPTV